VGQVVVVGAVRDRDELTSPAAPQQMSVTCILYLIPAAVKWVCWNMYRRIEHMMQLVTNSRMHSPSIAGCDLSSFHWRPQGLQMHLPSRIGTRVLPV
jgi:hypothetical protein